jgi:hypothetical protein
VSEEDRKSQLRQEIMITVRANNLQVSGEFWLMLAFRSEAELKQIASELNVYT